MRRRPKVAVLGGTFDHLHRGHEALLRAAFRAADTIAIGLTSDAYLERHPKPYGNRMESFTTRRRNLEAYLATTFPSREWKVVPLEDAFGGSLAPGVDVLIVSSETREGAQRVNDERRRRRLPPLRLVVIPLVRAEDRLPLQSRRIRAGAVTADGRTRAARRRRATSRRPTVEG